MLNRSWKVLVLIVTLLCSFSFVSEDVFARRGGGGGFSSSRSRSSSSRSSSWSKRKSSGTRKAAVKAKPSKPKFSKADSTSIAKAKKNNTSFSGKGGKQKAQAAFKAKHGAKYTQKSTPGKAAPKTRPEHIPATTQVGGKTVNVNYNINQGGYGHWSGGGMGLGTFMMYNMMSDAIMMNTMMGRNNYHYGGMYAPVHGPMVGNHGGGFSVLEIIGGIVVIGFFVAVAVVMINS